MCTIKKQVDEMSYLQVSAARPSLRVPDRCNTVHGLAVRYVAPVNVFNLDGDVKRYIGSSKRCVELMKCNVMQNACASRYQPCTPVCSFGGKEAKSGDEV